MPDSLSRAAIPLSRFANPGPASATQISDEWQSHVHAGRIGNPAPVTAETLACRAAMVALFDRIRG